MIERHVGGIEFVPGVQRYSLNANWKIASENFTGDTYHLPYSHGSMYKLDIPQINPANPSFRGKEDEYFNIGLDNGHGMTGIVFGGERYDVDRALAESYGPEVVEYVEECQQRLVKAFPKHQAGLYALSFSNMFPNLSFNDFSALRPIGFYLWIPKGPDRLEAWNWCAIDRDAPKVIKEQARVDFTRIQAVSGIAAQDDTENFEQVTEATRGVVGQRLDFNYQMNVGQPLLDGPKGCPGRFSPYISETNQLNFYQHWRRSWMRRGPAGLVVDAALQHRVEQFLYREVRLLSELRLEEWLELFTDDARYWMPARETVDGQPDAVAADGEMAFFDDDKAFLASRIERLRSSLAHAEQPPSRMRYFVSNVEIEEASEDELDVRCNLLVYQSRLERTEVLYVGRREDRLRPDGGSWRIARRKVILDQTLIPRTMSTFF